MSEKEIGAAAFKVRCLQLLDELPREGIIITKRGKAIARLTPIVRGNAELLGCLQGKLEIFGEIMSTGEEWSADEDNL